MELFSMEWLRGYASMGITAGLSRERDLFFWLGAVDGSGF